MYIIMLHETLSQERGPKTILVGREQANRQKLKGDRAPFNKNNPQKTPALSSCQSSSGIKACPRSTEKSRQIRDWLFTLSR